MVRLSDYLELTPDAADSQWSNIHQRLVDDVRRRFTPVETILCYGLLRVVPNPHRYGSKTHSAAPTIVHILAQLFRRKSSSLILKMVNLNGRLPHGSKFDLPFFVAMNEEPDRYWHLYEVTIRAARRQGIDASRLPDFLEDVSDEVSYLRVPFHLEDTAFETQALDSAIRGTPLALEPGETTKVVLGRRRIGQEAFSNAVRQRFGGACGFCGLAPKSLPKEGLIWGSHIKPWSDSDEDERLDPSNGIAACRMHDAAFDRGLITLETDLRIRRSRRLTSSIEKDDGAAHYFGPVMKERLILPPGAEPPHDRYLSWHREYIYRDSLP